MVFAILKRIEKECRGIPVDRKMKADDIEYLYSEKVAVSSYKVTVSGLIGVQSQCCSVMMKECSPPAKRMRVQMYQNVQQRNWWC